MLTSSRVAISTGHEGYHASRPYSPAVCYPEYPFGSSCLSEGANPAYEGVRDALSLLGLDEERAGTAQWNPLGEIIRPRNTVVLKPNFIRHFRETQSGHDDCLITHGSIIRAAIDYVYIALGGRGRIIVADAPQNDADFEAILRIVGLAEIQEFYRRRADFNVEVYDLRPERAKKVNGVICGHLPLPGDPAGYVKVNLDQYSMFEEIGDLCGLLYGAEYDTRELRSHHHDHIHEYLISGTVLEADCVINLPKLKTHKKTGITVSLKNLVGINGNKNWLPHHREGTPAQGGDQFNDDGLIHRIERLVNATFKRIFPFLGPFRTMLAGVAMRFGTRIFGDTNTDTVRSGNWYGNDTTWRMVADLNRILIYADAEGTLHDKPVRRFFSIVDAIVAGEGNGPLDPTPKPAGIVLAGCSPIAVDLACARLMGFDYRKLPGLCRALAEHELPLASFSFGDVAGRSNDESFDRSLTKFIGPIFAFKPHFGWMGHIEIDCRYSAYDVKK